MIAFSLAVVERCNFWLVCVDGIRIAFDYFLIKGLSINPFVRCSSERVNLFTVGADISSVKIWIFRLLLVTPLPNAVQKSQAPIKGLLQRENFYTMFKMLPTIFFSFCSLFLLFNFLSGTEKSIPCWIHCDKSERFKKSVQKCLCHIKW